MGVILGPSWLFCCLDQRKSKLANFDPGAASRRDPNHEMRLHRIEDRTALPPKPHLPLHR